MNAIKKNKETKNVLEILRISKFEDCACEATTTNLSFCQKKKKN